jgi:cytochrome bd-type quinol oxidase subunit 2
MLVLTLIGLPFVLGYTVWIHRVFQGKADEGLHY